MREVTASGQTVEEAVQTALKQLSMSREDVEIDVIDQGKKGFLGIFGATRAIVKVREKGEAEEVVPETISKPEVHKDNVENTVPSVEEESEEEIDVESRIAANIEEAEVFLKEVSENMGVEVEVETIIQGRQATFQLSGEKIAILIGKRGKTLNAIQYLTQLVVNKDGRHFRSVIVDAEGYRSRREATLRELAQKMASKAMRIEGKVALEPMPAYERKIIHSSLQHSDEVSTYSDGVEPHRYIVIEPNK